MDSLFTESGVIQGRSKIDHIQEPLFANTILQPLNQVTGSGREDTGRLRNSKKGKSRTLSSVSKPPSVSYTAIGAPKIILVICPPSGALCESCRPCCFEDPGWRNGRYCSWSPGWSEGLSCWTPHSHSCIITGKQNCDMLIGISLFSKVTGNKAKNSRIGSGLMKDKEEEKKKKEKGITDAQPKAAAATACMMTAWARL